MPMHYDDHEYEDLRQRRREKMRQWAEAHPGEPCPIPDLPALEEIRAPKKSSISPDSSSSPLQPRSEREMVLTWQIARHLASRGYIVEVTSIQHHRAGRGKGTGQTKGIGDLLVYRTSYGRYLHPGCKINADVKLPQEGQLSREQKVAWNDGGLLIWESSEQAEREMKEIDARFAHFAGVDLSVLTDTVGRVGHKLKAEEEASFSSWERLQEKAQRKRSRASAGTRIGGGS